MPNEKVSNEIMHKRAQKLRREMTDAERHLWYDCLCTFKPKFRRQYVIDTFIVDFYCPVAKLAIELDGSQHYTDLGLRYDAWRTSKLGEKDILVIRFTNLDIFKQFREVGDYLDYILKERLKELGKYKWIAW